MAARSALLTQELHRLKREVFRIPHEFRQHQLAAMQACAEGRSIFFVAATGQGKSLVYQLPSMLKHEATTNNNKNNNNKGPTVVVSPLKALIHDQVSQLRKLDIPCEALHGGIQIQSIASKLDTLAMLFVTPEQLVPWTAADSNGEEEDVSNSPLINLLLDGKAQLTPRRFVFDEAHCILHWGKSFRPKYLKAVQSVVRDFPHVPITLLSATAPPTIRQDLQKLFTTTTPMDVFVSDELGRDNLEYQILHKPACADELFDKLVALLKDVKCAIVYCVTKDQVDALATRLGEALASSSIQRYHGGMTEAKRALAMRLWQSGLSRIMIATNAFGMGVNHAGVRLVVHTAMPLSLTDYIQQCGRAGRDGQPAKCVLFYNVRGDVVQAKKLVAEFDPQELDEMISLCVNQRSCVRRVLANKAKGAAAEAAHDEDTPCRANCTCRGV